MKVVIENAVGSCDPRLKYYGLALKIAQPFYQGTTFDADLRSAAVYGMLKAVERLQTGQATDENPTAYVGQLARFEVVEAIRRRPVVRIPNATMRRRRKAGGGDLEIFAPEDWDNIVHTDPVPCGDTAADYEAELRLTADEKHLIEQRLSGLTIRDIAKQAGVSPSLIMKRVAKLQKKWRCRHGR